MKNDFTEQEREFLRQKLEGDKEKAKAELLDKRMAWADQIQILSSEKDNTLPRLKQDLEKKSGMLVKAKQAWEAAQAQAAKAKVDFSQAQHRFETKIDNIQGQLLQTADPEITEAIQFFQDQHEKIRNPSNFRKFASEGKFNILKLRRDPADMESNYKAINGALSYCRAAIQELQNMKLQVEPDLERIELLKNGIPDFKETLTPYQEPRPFEDMPEKTNFLGPRPVSKTERLLDQCAKQFNI